jgi:hypothetical protein
MKNVGDERVRMAGMSAHHGGGIVGIIPSSVSHNLMSAVGGKGRASISMPGELDAGDHPAFETIRSITRLVAIHTPGVLVSARDVDFVCPIYFILFILCLCVIRCCSAALYRP